MCVHGDGGPDLQTAIATRYLLPTPNPFHAGNTEDPDGWRHRRADVFERTGTRHGPALSVVALSVEQGDPLTPDNYMPDDPEALVVDEEGEALFAGDLLPTPTARDWKNAGDPAKTAGRMAQRGQPLTEVAVNALLPTPLAQDAKQTTLAPSRHDRHSYELSGIDALLPTPVTDPESANGHARSLGTEARLLPTPRATDGTKGGPNQAGASGDLMLPSAVQPERLLPTPMVGSSSPAAHGQVSGQWRDQMAAALARWGDYAPAILRWTTMLDRTAPDPTEPGSKGQPRLSARFVEWMMGLPAGHVTDVPGVSRNDQLKALGNGVVQQQAEAGLRWLLVQTP